MTNLHDPIILIDVIDIIKYFKMIAIIIYNGQSFLVLNFTAVL